MPRSASPRPERWRGPWVKKRPRNCWCLPRTKKTRSRSRRLGRWPISAIGARWRCSCISLRPTTSQCGVTAAITLQALTGKEFAYAAYDSPNKREAAIAKWTTWVNGDGRTAKLNFPLKPLGIGASYLNGNTLLAFGYTNRVVEYDPSQREVWSYEIPGAWSAEKLPNGDVLIASNQGGR